MARPTGVGQHMAQMVTRLAREQAVSGCLVTTKGDYAQTRPHLSQDLLRLPVRFLPSAERLMRGVLCATSLLNLERWAGDVEWVYSPKEQPVATKHARLAVTVHDVFPLEPPIPGLQRTRRTRSSLRWRLMLSRTFQRADVIATVSEFTKRRLLDLFRVRDDERIVVVGNGVAPTFFRNADPRDGDVLRKYGLTQGEYVVAVGSLTFRKGGDLLLDVAERLREKDLPLRILVAGRRHDAELVARFERLRNRAGTLPLQLAGYVPDQELPALLSHSLALLFPSRYEGFGIPALEAMAAGTPVVCSRRAALPEVVGEAGLFLDDLQVDAVLGVIEKLAGSSELREQTIGAGRRRAAEFTWDRCASRLLSALGCR